MLFINILLTCLLALITPLPRYECSSKNIFIILEKVSTSNQSAVLLVRDTINLKGRKLTLTNNIELVVEGGSFSNGSIIGNRTTLVAGAYPIFEENLIVSGTWVTDNAYAEWFGQTGSLDDTKKIQKCLDTFFKCKLLNKYYNVTTLNVPDNASLEGDEQGRYRKPTLHQIEEYKGDLITTGNKAYSGISLSGFRITGGQESNTAISISVPNSQLNGIICDEYFGNGIRLIERAWGAKLYRCSVFGNRDNAKVRGSQGVSILVDTNGGLISIEQCDINYYQTGILINRGAQVTVRGCSISECSRNQFKKTGACIKVKGGTSISIYDNYLENFNVGIDLVKGMTIEIHNNYINGLSVASYGIYINDGAEKIEIRNNHIHMGFKGAWAIACRSKVAEKQDVHLINNDLDEKKLYNIR